MNVNEFQEPAIRRTTKWSTKWQRREWVIDELFTLVDSLICILTMGHFLGGLSWNRKFGGDEGV
tara:strand:- start:768 stop:959 length:192 start_codon:yes stop_codon:yes gene_type:complete